MNEISPIILEKAPIILAEIKKANNILLHCHPSPDPDSVGSALAMKFVLEQLGKKATVIKGDSDIPQAFVHFPGAKEIVQKNFFQVELKDFDLFIILDSGGIIQVSRVKPIEFPLPVRTIIIDHHISNLGFADTNLVEPRYPATAQILADLFTLWGIKMNADIAINLFMGIYTDTGAFRYLGTTSRTFSIIAELVKDVPSITDVISKMDDSNNPTFVTFQALALNSIQTFFGDQVALSIVSNQDIKNKNIPYEDIRPDAVVPILRSVKQWNIVVMMTEVEQDRVRINMRSKDERYDVSKLAESLGGGGHKMASGTRLEMPLEEAKKLVLTKAKEVFGLR